MALCLTPDIACAKAQQAAEPAAEGARGTAGADLASGAKQDAATDTKPQARRAVSFTVPLVDRGNVLGDVLIRVATPDLVEIDRKTLLSQLAGLLAPDALKQIAAATASTEYLSTAMLTSAGIETHFDSGELQLVIDSIQPNMRVTEQIGGPSQSDTFDTLTVNTPATFSAYLNGNLNLDYGTGPTAQQKPDLFLNGAARYKNVLLLYDGAFSQQFGNGYRFYRHGVQAIYDLPGSYVRLTAGDLEMRTIDVLRTPYIGGIGIEKNRQLFNGFLPASPLGGRQIFLNNRSTVDVYVNGQKYQTYQLDAGKYNLSNLPVETGSNNVTVRIRDSAGKVQTLDYNYFFQPLNLEPGQDEYSAAIGFQTADLSYEPHYTTKPAFVGYYRRAMSRNLLLGGGLEASSRTQVVALTTTIVPQIIPGAFYFDGAISHGRSGAGEAVNASYTVTFGRNPARLSQFTLNLNYQSARYETLGEEQVNNFDLATISGSYSKSLSDWTFVTAGVQYTHSGTAFGNSKTVYAQVSHRLNQRLRLTAGVEYGSGSIYFGHFGAQIGISLALGGDMQATADYRSLTRTFRADVSRGADTSYAGSIGYDLGFDDSGGQTTGNAGVEYVGNRFDARASVFTQGDSFGHIADEQQARIQIGSSLAFADGAFGVGRPISDSFAVVHPYAGLGKKVIAGQSLSNNRAYANSGILGGAVQGDLSSYSAQNVQFDIDAAQPTYAVGSGTVYVKPPYRAGYNVVVGNGHFVSVIGNLVHADGSPAKLVSGRIASADDKDFQSSAFFTNSVGRFAIIGLAPGKRYTVVLDNDEGGFTISVPDTNKGLMKLGTVTETSK